MNGDTSVVGGHRTGFAVAFFFAAPERCYAANGVSVEYLRIFDRGSPSATLAVDELWLETLVSLGRISTTASTPPSSAVKAVLPSSKPTNDSKRAQHFSEVVCDGGEIVERRNRMECDDSSEVVCDGGEIVESCNSIYLGLLTSIFKDLDEEGNGSRGTYPGFVDRRSRKGKQCSSRISL
ncbi:hypothetical protein BHM03_00040782 [Ensete ventricosum]|nr:hypothetical protein BHM03_00040782 [Ensete ventricosum]